MEDKSLKIAQNGTIFGVEEETWEKKDWVLKKWTRFSWDFGGNNNALCFPHCIPMGETVRQWLRLLLSLLHSKASLLTWGKMEQMLPTSCFPVHACMYGYCSRRSCNIGLVLLLGNPVKLGSNRLKSSGDFKTQVLLVHHVTCDNILCHQLCLKVYPSL